MTGTGGGRLKTDYLTCLLIAEETDLTEVENNWEMLIHYIPFQRASIN